MNDHRWDLDEGDRGYVPECEDAFEEKLEEWEARDWMDWLGKQLTFPFFVKREEDDDDAYFGDESGFIAEKRKLRRR